MARSNVWRAAAALMMAAAWGCSAHFQAASQPAARPLAAPSAGRPGVLAYYLVPTDRLELPAYRFGISIALSDLQNWYREAMNGRTFHLADPVVSTVRLPHPAQYYATHPNGDNRILWFWNNLLDDADTITGASAPGQQVRLYYIDADPACGQVTGGSLGIAVLPANDLRGLVGEPTKAICQGEGQQYRVNRYIGGSGHELGHAFGLDHPPGCDANPPTGDLQALMCLGYLDYPMTHLTQQDVDQLGKSPFFAASVAVSTAMNNEAR